MTGQIVRSYLPFRIAPLLPALAALALIVTPARPAHACRCATPSMVTTFRAADAVFVGRVTGVATTPLDPAVCQRHRSRCLLRYTYTVEVERVWKGAVPATVEVFAGHGRGDCSFGKLRGVGPWLFMARGPIDHLTIRTCGGTRRATAATRHALTHRFGAGTVP